MKKFTALLSLILMFTLSSLAQSSDTIPYSPGISTPDGVAGIAAQITQYIPNVGEVLTKWLPIVLIIFGAIQFTLKRIPTPFSVKITGPLGWILDFLTAFQKDITLRSVAFLIGVLSIMSLSGCFISKDCHLTASTLTGTTQNICLKCDSLAEDASQYIGSHVKVKIPVRIQ